MIIDEKQLAEWRRLCAPLPTVRELPMCSVVGCDNGADPRGCVWIGEVNGPACDAHWGTLTGVTLREPLPEWPRRIDDVQADALKALPSVLDEIDSLQRALDEARAEIERLKARPTEAHHVAVRDAAYAWQTDCHKAEADRDSARAERDGLRARLAAIEPVFEAAVKWYEWYGSDDYQTVARIADELWDATDAATLRAASVVPGIDSALAGNGDAK